MNDGAQADVSPIHVILNDRPLRQTLTGVGHYIAQLLSHLPDAAPDVRADPFFFTYLSQHDWRATAAPVSPPRKLDEGAPVSSASPPAAKAVRHPRDVGGSRKPWWVRRVMQGVYSSYFRWKAGKYDVYHEPNHIPMRCDLPTVTTIHDLSVLVHPEWHPADRVRWYAAEFDAGVRQTRVFIAASEFTKREMIEQLGVPAERVRVTYQAPRAAFTPPSEAAVAAALARQRLAPGFFLYVGTLEPRKNVAGLLEAFARLPAATRERHPLVIVGAWGWKQDALRDQLARHGVADQCRLTGYLHDEDLASLYASCAAFVWPSFYEGFGLPPLEAMACGAPVIISNAASLPEVVGEAGALLDPADVVAWCQAMRRSAEDASARATAVERSLAQAGRFSWRRCAAETAACYRAALL